MGYPTRFVFDEEWCTQVPSGDASGNVHIEIRTCKDYFIRNLGVVTPAGDLEWLSIPEHKLLVLTGGEVFFDGVGELTALRQFYQAYYPPNVWKYRLAYAWQSLGWDIDLIGLRDTRGDFISTRNNLNTTLFNIIKLTFLLNRRYSHSYPKWLGKEFYKLPHLSDSIGPVLESCYLDIEIKSVIEKLETVCHLLLIHQNNLDGLPELSFRKNKRGRGFFSSDLQYIADQICQTIDGPLSSVPLYGALDQWVTNQDLQLNTGKSKCLSVVYEQEGKGSSA